MKSTFFLAALAFGACLARTSDDCRSARQEIRDAIADSSRFEEAVSCGLKSKDALIRRFALNALIEKDEARGVMAAKAMLDDPSEEMQLFLLDVAGRIADADVRNAFIASIAARSRFPDVVNAAERRGGFGFFRVNLPMSQDPENDHELQLACKIDIPVDGWLFSTDVYRNAHRGKCPFFSPRINEGGWKRIEIGKPWEEQGFDGYDGIGWYRRTFEMPPRPSASMTVELCFDAVDEEAWVWINGKYVGQHADGPAGWNKPFRFRVDDEIVWGGENLLTVRVNDSCDVGGIWRGVRLEVLR